MIKVLKVIGQGALVWVLLQLGILLSALLKPILYIPGSLLGMMLLFGLLLSGVIKLSYIEELSGFLLKNMGFFFIPLGVSLLQSVDLLKAVWLQLLLVLIISCALVMFVSAKVTELMIGRLEKRRES